MRHAPPHRPGEAHRPSKARVAAAEFARPSGGLATDGHASFLSCVANLANTTIGIGVLTLPAALATAGLEAGLGLLVLSCMLAVVSLSLIHI